MKNLLIGLLVLSALVSCGKKNSVSSAEVVPVTSTNPITVTDAAGISLGAKIDNYTVQFGTGQVIYSGNIETWNRVLQVGVALKYQYTKSTSSSSNSNCEKKWGIFYVCSYSSSNLGSTTSASVSRTEYSGQFDQTAINAKINELKAIINRTNALIPIQLLGTTYYITTLDGKRYAIDTKYPLQANPIGIMDVSATGGIGAAASSNTGATEYLINITDRI